MPAPDWDVHCYRYHRNLRLAGGLLVCREKDGQLAWRLSEDESADFITAAIKLVKQPSFSGSTTIGRLRLGRVGNIHTEKYIFVNCDGKGVKLSDTDIGLLLAALKDSRQNENSLDQLIADRH